MFCMIFGELLNERRDMKQFMILCLLSLTIGLSAQISRGDLERATSKGKAMMQKGSLEDAVAVFNEILSKDPTEGRALLLRARAKYELSAYKGAKKDCFAYMDIYGIDDEVAGLLGKTEKGLENYKQALAYLKTALMFNPDGLEYLMDRAEIFYNLGLDEQACIDWHQAMLNGSQEAEALSRKNCKRVRIPIDDVRNDSEPVDYDEEEKPDEAEDEESTDTSESDDEEEVEKPDNTEDDGETVPDRRKVDQENNDDEEEVEPEDEEEKFPLDTRVEEIYVDDDLTVRIADGIGSRKLTDMPDILILSDKSGEVVVDICVDRMGRVVANTLNEDLSTLKTASLVSLALRESSNFRFARSSRKNHCGTITFVITGSN